jgi:hypothetical protein
VSVTVRAVFGKRSGQRHDQQAGRRGLRAVVQRAERWRGLRRRIRSDAGARGRSSISTVAGGRDTTAQLDRPARTRGAQRSPSRRRGRARVDRILEAQRTAPWPSPTRKRLVRVARRPPSALTTTVRTTDGTGSGWAGATSHH